MRRCQSIVTVFRVRVKGGEIVEFRRDEQHSQCSSLKLKDHLGMARRGRYSNHRADSSTAGQMDGLYRFPIRHEFRTDRRWSNEPIHQCVDLWPEFWGAVAELYDVLDPTLAYIQERRYQGKLGEPDQHLFDLYDPARDTLDRKFALVLIRALVAKERIELLDEEENREVTAFTQELEASARELTSRLIPDQVATEEVG